MCEIICENESRHEHSCPMNGLDNLEDVRCNCCSECTKGCKDNRSQILEG